MSRRRGERTMEVRPPRRRSENPRTVDVAHEMSKQESMGKACADNVPTGHRGRGGVPAGRLHANWLGLIPRGWLLKWLRPARYALHPGAWLRALGLMRSKKEKGGSFECILYGACIWKRRTSLIPSLMPVGSSIAARSSFSGVPFATRAPGCVPSI